MSRLSHDELMVRVAVGATMEAWLTANASYWEGRARELEQARPHPGDFPGHATLDERVARWHRLTEAAEACRRRATGDDGWAGKVLDEAATALHTSTPVASPVADVRIGEVAVAANGVRTAVVECPFCRRTHSHGWPAEDLDVGHRRAHCGLGSYYVHRTVVDAA